MQKTKQQKQLVSILMHVQWSQFQFQFQLQFRLLQLLARV